MSLTALAAEIIKHARILDSYIAAHNLPQPSFDVDGPLDFPILPDETANKENAQLQASRTALLDTCQALHDLTAGPVAAVVWPALTGPYQLLMISRLHRLSIPQAVPLDGGATVPEIAAKIGLEEDLVSRIIKYACSYRIFREEMNHSGIVIRHTAASRAFIQHDGLRDSLSVCLDERFQRVASMLLADGLPRQNSDKEEKEREDESGDSDCVDQEPPFNKVFRTDDNYLAHLRRGENRHVLSAIHGFLGYVMRGTNMGVRNHNVDMLVNSAFDWDSLEDSLVVDVGGGHGHVSASIAQKYTKLRFIVQDLPTVVAQGERVILSIYKDHSDVTSRISFMAHDMFTPQPRLINADVFMFRFVLHDWPDDLVVKILRNLFPEIKSKTGCRIIIMDYLLPETGTERCIVERMERTMDLSMLAILKGKERCLQDWLRIVKMVDARLGIANVYKETNDAFGIIELAIEE